MQIQIGRTKAAIPKMDSYFMRLSIAAPCLYGVFGEFSH